MIERIIAAHPRARTIIFQDDIFTFTRDRRILPLCEGIVAAKQSGRIPAHLQFISTNRIDSMSVERLTAMRRAGFRVLGFGIESFSQRVLGEFNKAQIHRHIEPMLSAALATGVTPFLDLILSSPRADSGGCGGDAARGVSLDAPGVRDRDVSLRHSVFGGGIFARLQSFAAYALRASAGRGHRYRLGAAGKDSADRSASSRT